jgi:hypothetical protein
MSDLSDNEIKTLLGNLQQNLQNRTDGASSLEVELESAAKHIPAYVKIVKSHIDQLRRVLELENHNHRTLETAGLAAPVQQLIKLFNTLQDEDLQLLEDLSHAARNWLPETAEMLATADRSSMYEETTS